MRRVWGGWIALVLGFSSAACAQDSDRTSVDATARKATALADEFIEALRTRFPLRYEYFGLPGSRRDLLNINAPKDLEAWRALQAKLNRAAQAIDAAVLEGRPEWTTLALLKQALVQNRSAEICRIELWSVTSFGWQNFFAQVAEMQPVGDARNRADMLSRFGQVPAFVDQEIANLREGQRLGYSASRSAVEIVLKQLNTLLEKPLAESAYFSPAQRDTDEAFRRAWQALLDSQLRPTLIRYREYLRTSYLPRARANASISTNRDGVACYRARLTADSSIDIDPKELYSRGVAQVEKETQEALQAGLRRYRKPFATRAELAEALRTDPENHFDNADELERFIEGTVKRAKAGADRVVLHPPTTDLQLKRFPLEGMASGQYYPADREGTRPATYYYSVDYQNLSPARLEPTVLHETWPGHHLQFEVARAHGNGTPHPLVQLVYLPGVGEGWATYASRLAGEQGLYASELGIIGNIFDSMTPRLVADLGMHVLGWSEEETWRYLVTQFPSTPPERVRKTVAAIADTPGVMLPYALGEMQILEWRTDAQHALAERFDLREFHQLLIEDGTVPFPALRMKLDRWIRARQK